MLPKYIEPQIYHKDNPYVGIKYYFKKYTLFALFLIATTAIAIVVPYFIFKTISQTEHSDFISLGASLVTFFSATIAVICLLDNLLIRQYDDNVKILESKYTGKNSGWSFVRRFSYKICKGSINHKLSNAKYIIYYNDDAQKYVEVIVPILYANFYDAPCIKSLLALRCLIPKYKKYIFNKHSTEDVLSIEENKQYIHYLILPEILRALFKDILYMRILRFLIFLCNLLILSTIVMTIVFH